MKRDKSRDAQYWIFADIQYADMLQLVANNQYWYWYIYILFLILHRKDHQVSSVVELKHSIIIHALTVLAHQQMQA